MRKIEAIIRPHFVEKLRATLPETGINGMTCSETIIWKREFTNENQIKWGKEPRLKVEIVIPEQNGNELASAVLDLIWGIEPNAYIWISSIEGSVRIRTGQNDDESLN